MRVFVFVFPFLFGLFTNVSAQVSTSELQQAANDYARDKVACTQIELTRQNVWQQRNCIDQALVSRLGAAGYTHMDWVDQLVTGNRAAAASYYRGVIT